MSPAKKRESAGHLSYKVVKDAFALWPEPQESYPATSEMPSENSREYFLEGGGRADERISLDRKL